MPGIHHRFEAVTPPNFKNKCSKVGYGENMKERGYMPKAKSVEWATPQELFDALDKEFSFTLDPCATHENAKCAKYYTKEQDGLAQSWAGERVFMNPPYGKEAANWIAKAYVESNYAEVIVVLLPVRSDTAWFHDFIYGKAEIRFLRGRVRFVGPHGTAGSATFPSMIMVWVRKARGEHNGRLSAGVQKDIELVK